MLHWWDVADMYVHTLGIHLIIYLIYLSDESYIADGKYK